MDSPCLSRKRGRVDGIDGRVEEQKRRSALWHVPRADCEDIVRTELLAAVSDRRDEQAQVRLPAEILRAPVGCVATSNALSLEQLLQRSLVRLDRRQSRH